jgi:hypothetical protein
MATSLPYKNTAVALLFSVFFGPVGLLYASWRGGALMVLIMIFMFSNKYFFLALVIWLICCIWSVAAVESYNKKLMNKGF